MWINFKNTAISLFLGAFILSACQSKTDKIFHDSVRVDDPQKVLKEIQTEAKEKATETAGLDDWKTFRIASKAKLNEFDINIADLKLKMNIPGLKPDLMNEKKMLNLELKNQNLKTKLEAYVHCQSNFQACQTDFNRDLSELEKSIKVLLSHYSK